MKDSGISGSFRVRLAVVVIAVLAIVMAGCSPAVNESDSTADTDIEQSAATTLMLETVSTEITETPTPTPSPTPMPTLTPKERIVTVSFAGDCTLTQDYRSSNRMFDSTVDGDMEYCFQNCAEMFKNDDLTLVNLENPVTTATNHKNNQYIFRMDPENLEMLTTAGIEAVNIANNHTQDFLQEGLEDTRNNLDEYGIVWSDDKFGATYTTKQGVVIGMVGLGNDTNASAVFSIIDGLREDGAAIIIASCHFGSEGVYEPTDRQKKVAHELIDYGVDIVVGTHPHRLQPIEKYNGHYIFYSLSNFCFGGNYSLSDPDSVIILYACVQDLVFHYWANRDLRVAFSTHPESQASS